MLRGLRQKGSRANVFPHAKGQDCTSTTANTLIEANTSNRGERGPHVFGKRHRHLSFAMAIATAWMWGLPLFGVLQAPLYFTPETASVFSFYFLVGNVLGYCAYAAIFAQDKQATLAVISPLINAVLMILLLLYSRVGPTALPLAPVLALMMGIFSAALTLLWATTVSERPPDKRGRYVAAMLLFASLIHSVILAAAHLAPESAYLLTVILMGGCWRLAHSGTLDHQHAEDTMREPSNRQRLRLYTFWLLFACLLTAYYSLSWLSHLSIFATAPQVGGLAPIVAGLAYGGVALVAGTVIDRTGEIEGVAMVGLAILISTFIFIPIVANLTLLDFFLQSSYGILDVFVLTYLAQAAGLFRGPTYRFYACGLAANAIVVASGYAWVPSTDLALAGPTHGLISLLKAVSLIIGSVSIMILRGLRLSQEKSRQEPASTPKEQLQEAFDAAGFTDRERDVARLILRGCSNQEIAEELQITINTLKTHVRHIYSKTESSNRATFILKMSGHAPMNEQKEPTDVR